MILSFKCRDTEKLANGVRVLRFLQISHDRLGQYSIRINRQFRLCFCWTTAGVTDVEIVDYH